MHKVYQCRLMVSRSQHISILNKESVGTSQGNLDLESLEIYPIFQAVKARLIYTNTI